MAIEHKNAVGWFRDQSHAESALSQLKASGFDMNKVSVVVQHPDSKDSELETLTGSEVQAEDRFRRDRTAQRIEHGALDAGLWGTLGGGLVAGLTALALPASGAVLLVGMATGGFYGAVSGGLLGGAVGNGLSNEQARDFENRLANGDYLVVVEGSDDEITKAKSVLEAEDIQDWMAFETL